MPAAGTDKLLVPALAPHPQLQSLALLIDFLPPYPVTRPSQQLCRVCVSQPSSVPKATNPTNTCQNSALSNSRSEPLNNASVAFGGSQPWLGILSLSTATSILFSFFLFSSSLSVCTSSSLHQYSLFSHQRHLILHLRISCTPNHAFNDRSRDPRLRRGSVANDIPQTPRTCGTALAIPGRSAGHGNSESISRRSISSMISACRAKFFPRSALAALMTSRISVFRSSNEVVLSSTS